MKEIYVKAADLNEDILNELPNKDIFSLDEVIGAFEELAYRNKMLEQEFEDYKEMVNTDFKEISKSALYGVPESCYDR